MLETGMKASPGDQICIERALAVKHFHEFCIYINLQPSHYKLFDIKHRRVLTGSYKSSPLPCTVFRDLYPGLSEYLRLLNDGAAAR